MGRHQNPIDTSRPARAHLATALRRVREESGLTYTEMADRCTASAATLKRAASGTSVPKEWTVREYVKACTSLSGSMPLNLVLPLHRAARMEERGILTTLSAPDIHLISDERDLSRALEVLYERDGARPMRDIQDRSDNSYALPMSTLRRIVKRRTIPADEQQLLAFVHGCGDHDHDQAWKEAWAKVTGTAAATALAPSAEWQPSFDLDHAYDGNTAKAAQSQTGKRSPLREQLSRLAREPETWTTVITVLSLWTAQQVASRGGQSRKTADFPAAKGVRRSFSQVPVRLIASGVQARDAYDLG